MSLQLTLINNSGKPGNLFAFQRFGGQRQSLAWLSKYAYPGTQVDFFWDPATLSFVWSGTGRLGPGVVVDIAQFVPAAVSGTNQVTLSYDAEHRTFFFHDQGQGPQSGQLFIRQDQTIPANSASVGVGMANKATLVFEVQPNMMIAIDPRTSLWVAFGDYKQGQYIDDVEALGAVEVAFPPNVVAMTATIDADGKWTVAANVLDKRPDEAS